LAASSLTGLGNFLKQDFGISEVIALRLSPPVDTPFLRMCSKNAESECGRALYYGIREVSQQVPAPPFNDPVAFWQTLGRSVFEFNRCLSIISGRIYPVMPIEHKRAYRLPWLDSEDVFFLKMRQLVWRAHFFLSQGPGNRVRTLSYGLILLMQLPLVVTCFSVTTWNNGLRRNSNFSWVEI